jgi:hypothetical protein
MNARRIATTVALTAGLLLGGTGIAAADSVPAKPVGPAKVSFQKAAERQTAFYIKFSERQGERYMKVAERRACRFIPSC